MFKPFKNLMLKMSNFFEQHDMPATAAMTAMVARSPISSAIAVATVVILGALPSLGFLLVGVGSLVVGLPVYEAAVNKISRFTHAERVNDVGQKVAGRAYDLDRLEAAQLKISSICSKFNAAADQAQLDKQVAEIVASVGSLRAKVKVVDAGQQGASADKYDFRKTVVTITTATASSLVR